MVSNKNRYIGSLCCYILLTTGCGHYTQQMDPGNSSNQEERNPKSELEQLQCSEFDEQRDKMQYCMQQKQCKEKLCRCCKSCVRCDKQEGKKVIKLRHCYGAKQVCEGCKRDFQDLVAYHPPEKCGISEKCIKWTPKMGYAGCENPIDFLKSIKKVYCCKWKYFNYFGFEKRYCHVQELPAMSPDSDSQGSDSSDSSDSKALLKASSTSFISRKELEAQNAELKAQLQSKCQEKEQ